MDKPTTLGDIYVQQRYWDKRCKRASARRAAAEKTVEQCYKHLGVMVMVEQVADLLRPHFPDHTLRVLGPFGLRNETAIHAEDDSAITDTQRFYKTVGSLSFRPHHELVQVGNAYLGDGMTLRLVDRTRNTGEYPASSLGGINGFNYPEVKLPDTIEELAELLRASIKRSDEHV